MSNICEDYLGNVFNSESQMCRAYGIDPRLYNMRKKQGLPLKTCLTPYKNKMRNTEDNKFIYNGIKYNSLMDCCNKLGLSYHVVHNRVWSQGMDPVAAINKSYELMRKKAKKSA